MTVPPIKGSSRAQRHLVWVPFVLLWAVTSACNCSKPSVAPTPKALGEPCEKDVECGSGLCDAIPRTVEKICLQRCTEECPANQVCAQVGLNRYGCVPEREGLCQPCDEDADCPYPADKCIALGGVKFCGRDCSGDGRCPTTYTCDFASDGQGNQVSPQCQPESGTCQCTAANIGQTVPCERRNGFGSCIGKRICAADGLGTCDAQIPAEEVCNNVDDDCNGTVDDGREVLKCGVGQCHREIPWCVEGRLQTCMPGVPTAEVCDEEDNDCNGTIDDGFDKMSSVNHCGTCTTICSVNHGTPKCVNGQCDIASCDMGFDNCNGQIPDGCEANILTSLQNCGGCGHSCSAPHTVASCTLGRCDFQCEPGWVDLDNDVSNGCEYACTFQSTTDLPDLGFVDANCDGIDGEVGKGIFVSPLGNDGAAGTRAAPMRTLAAGMAAVVAGNKRDLYVSQGAWTEPLRPAAGKGVYGGYSPTNWARSTANFTTVTGTNAPLQIEMVTGVTVQLIQFIGAGPATTGETAYAAKIINASDIHLEALELRAANGTAGASGVAGTNGAPGGNGSKGQPGCEDSTGFCSTCPVPQAGAAGVSTCGRPGGRGGPVGKQANNGGAGAPGAGGTPGGQGIPWGWGNIVPGAPYVGKDGAAGAAGAAGMSGAGVGTFTVAGYVAALTTHGADGAPGNGGGGGGGGGGGEIDCNSYGGGGAGGGAAGCAGLGGRRGESGGASIGVFLYNATVTADQVTVITGNGGNGGNGGAGGMGGMGGAGGVASNGAGNEYGGALEQEDGTNGARGGNGGKGGNGGEGGAGGGGPVLGVVKAGVSTWTANAVTITLGAPGNPGTAGGSSGAPGLSQQEYP